MTQRITPVPLQSVPQLSRAHDDIILEWLTLREWGYSIREIGALYHCQPGSVARATNSVTRAASND